MAVAEDGSLKDGIWLLKSGDGYYLDETQVKSADQLEKLPYVGASKVIELLISQGIQGNVPAELFDFEGIRKWINENPPGSTDGKQWAMQLMAQAVLHGLMFIWRGEITTTLRGAADISTFLSPSKSLTDRLGWPGYRLIAVNTMTKTGDSSSELISWGQLLGENPEAYPPVEPAPASSNPADALKNLKSLLDEGLISEEEFNTKRREILARI